MFRICAENASTAFKAGVPLTDPSTSPPPGEILAGLIGLPGRRKGKVSDIDGVRSGKVAAFAKIAL
jgi:hypothetical protein